MTKTVTLDIPRTAEERARRTERPQASEICEALKRVIEAAERSLGDHVAPHDCFATGPLTGNPIADYVACPGCAQQEEIKRARVVLAKAEQR